jgi:RHS repeat-associated protein
LGRNKQTIAWEPSESRGLITKTLDFDVKGRPFRTWNAIPLPNLTTGLPSRIVTDYAARAQSFYHSDFGFTQVDYDQTPENRILKQYHPRMNGEASSFITFRYGVNTSPVAGYAAHQLLFSEKTDEDGNLFTEYFDKFGNQVKATQPLDRGYTDLALGGVSYLPGNTRYAHTLFTYDRAGRMILVTNPESQVTTIQYDSRGAVLMETHPDRGVSQFRYDSWGRLRFSKDAVDNTYPDPQVNCATVGCHRFQYVKYDKLGRQSESGIVFTTSLVFFDDVAYRNAPDWPTVGFAYKPHVVNVFGTVAPEKGLLVVTKVNHEFTFNAGMSVFTPTVADVYQYGHDVNGNVNLSKFVFNGLSGSHAITYKHNRKGQVVYEGYFSAAYNKNYFKTTVYDDFGRMVSNSSGYEDVAANQSFSREDVRYHYDVIGRLFKKQLGAQSGGASPWLETLDVFHDIRSRITGIQSGRFNMALMYDRRGNVMLQRWQNAQFDVDPTVWNQYRYYYDLDYRLIAADYSTVKFNQSPQTHKTAGVGKVLNGVDGAKVYDMAQDDYHFPAFQAGGELLRNPQLTTVLYTEAPALLAKLQGKLGAPAMNGFAPAFQFGEVDFLESVINPDLSFKKAGEMDLSQREWREEAVELVKIVEANTQAEALVKLQGTPGTLEALTLTGGSGTTWVAKYIGGTGTATGENAWAVIVPDDRYDTWYRYDDVGNFTRMKRRQRENGNWVLNQMDYSYPAGLVSNRLTSVVSTGGYYNTTFTCDGNGNVKSDVGENLSSLTCDWRNRPATMVKGNGDVLRYRYDASGMRNHRKVVPAVGMGYQEFFLPGIILDENGLIQRLDIAEGYAEVAANGKMLRRYVVGDWLGSPRVTIDENGLVIAAGDYYPYGRSMDLRDFNADPEGIRYRFTGHERDPESSYDYHGARYYNAEIGRYLGVDVLSGRAPGWSGYRYAFDNPLRFIDPTGNIEDNYHIYENGTITKEETDDATDSYILHKNNGQTVNIGTFQKTTVERKNSEGETISSDLVNIWGVNFEPLMFTSGNMKETNSYLRPELAAALFGAAYVYHQQTGLKFQLNQLTNSQGTHSGVAINDRGGNADIRYANVHGNVDENVFTSGESGTGVFDLANSINIKNSMALFGFSNSNSVLSENAAGNGPALTGSIFPGHGTKEKPFHHRHHIHFQAYNYSHVGIYVPTAPSQQVQKGNVPLSPYIYPVDKIQQPKAVPNIK